jgi:hypothetical protein
MKKPTVFALILALATVCAAIAAPVPTKATPDAAFCFVAYEWCLDGCADLGAYVGDTFATFREAQTFVAGLTPLQQQTVRLSVLPQYGRHVVVAYRTLRGQPRSPEPVGGCYSIPVQVRSFVSVETAVVELERKPVEVRASAAVIAIDPTPNYPTDGAILITLEAP